MHEYLVSIRPDTVYLHFFHPPGITVLVRLFTLHFDLITRLRQASEMPSSTSMSSAVKGHTNTMMKGCACKDVCGLKHADYAECRGRGRTWFLRRTHTREIHIKCSEYVRQSMKPQVPGVSVARAL